MNMYDLFQTAFLEMHITLQTAKRVQLEGIRAAENMKKKRERLCSVLIQKLCVKYGNSNENLITALVDQFVEEKAQIAPEDLARLEKEVVVALKNNTKATKAKSQQSNDVNIIPPAKIVEIINTESKSEEEDLRPPAPGSEWKVIAAWQELQAESKTEEEKRIARQKKVDFKRALDEHIEQSKIYKQNNVAKLDDIYQRNMLKDVAKFHEEEREKKMKIHAVGQEQLQVQKQQILDAKRRHELDKVEQEAFEKRLIAEAQAKIQAEADKQARIRAYAREQQAIVDKDNEENERIRSIQAKKDAEEDIRLQQEYAAKLDREEYARANAHKERMKKMEAAYQKSETEGAGKAEREERIKVERLLIKEQEKAEADAIAKEQKKALEKKLRLQQMLHENEKLLESKRAAKDLQRRTDEDYARRAMDDVAKFKSEQAAIKDMTHSKHLNYRKILDKQMANKPAQADPTSAAFLGRESLINRSLYEKAVHDPTVLKKLNSPDKPVNKGPRIATHK